jgi:hypothetical protein
MTIWREDGTTEAEVLEASVRAKDVKACRAYLQLFLDGKPIDQYDVLRALTVVTMDAVRKQP